MTQSPFARSTQHASGSFQRRAASLATALCGVLILAFASAAAANNEEADPNSKPADAVAAETSVDTTPALSAAAKKKIAARIASGTDRVVDAMQVDLTTKTDQNIQQLTAQTPSLSDVVSHRIAMRLDSATSTFRVNAYASARARAGLNYQIAGKQ